MKKFLLLIIIVSTVIACNTRKQVEKAVSYGNYDQAITTAIKKLSTNKNAKRKQDYVLMLRDAYIKATERDLSSIEHLKKDNNPELYREIFQLYLNLDSRQEAIKPLQPLAINGKEVILNFNDYSSEIAVSREKVSDYTYEKGLALLESDNKSSIREAYNELRYLDNINPNYENTRELLEEAHQRGMDYVIVSINNDTQQIIPTRLEDELLNFDTYGLNKFWSTYHANRISEVKYDYAMQLNLKQINISPERIKEREILREREIVDGWKYKKDRNGNVLKDTLGNDIKLDKIVNVRCLIREVTQVKTSQVIGDVVYVDLQSNQVLDSFPIDSNFIFENIFVKTRGDKRALIKEDRQFLNNRRAPFPSNEQMVYDTGEDLKIQLKKIINSYSIR
jgi:hypothetical protein